MVLFTEFTRGVPFPPGTSIGSDILSDSKILIIFDLSSFLEIHSVMSFNSFAIFLMSSTDPFPKSITKSFIDIGDLGSMRYVLPLNVLYSMGGIILVLLQMLIALHT